MRERILRDLDRNEELVPVNGADDFLVYLMGPYRGIDDELLAADVDSAFDERTSMHAHLQTLREYLRGSNCNAFLATDVSISGEEMNYRDQSVAFSESSDAIAFVLPYLAENVGVGVEIAAVLDSLSTFHQRRMRLFQERRPMADDDEEVRSEMIDELGNDWDLACRTFETKRSLGKGLGLFVREIRRDDRDGRLPPPDYR